MKRKVCIITGTRAEYGLLSSLMQEILNSDEFELQIIATGMHLSPEFGMTYRELEKDGFSINNKIEILLSADTPSAISKSMGLGLIGFSDAYTQLEPDIIILLGDRFETFAAASAALVARIPIAHIHGGESTEGAIDEAFRHSITKMSCLHFVATKEYRKRVVQLGEIPKRVFIVGSLGVDNIYKLNLLSRTEFEKAINFKLAKRNFLVTFHPATLESDSPEKQFINIIKVLDQFKDAHIIFSKSNSDMNGRVINNLIDDYVKSNSAKACAFKSLGYEKYLSAMQYVDAVVGNSSSGLIEAPTFKIGTINVGDRQKGRVRASSVIDCRSSKQSLTKALELLFSEKFQNDLKKTKNPYGKGGAAIKIMDVLSKTSLKNSIKKSFYDL